MERDARLHHLTVTEVPKVAVQIDCKGGAGRFAASGNQDPSIQDDVEMISYLGLAAAAVSLLVIGNTSSAWLM